MQKTKDGYFNTGIINRNTYLLTDTQSQMTKEEILNPYRKMSNAETSWLFEDDAKKAMDEYATVYAKQQAIAFIKWAIDGALQGDHYGGVSFSLPLGPDNAEQAYNQFTEQQNKE